MSYQEQFSPAAMQYLVEYRCARSMQERFLAGIVEVRTGTRVPVFTDKKESVFLFSSHEEALNAQALCKLFGSAVRIQCLDPKSLLRLLPLPAGGHGTDGNC